MTFDTELVSSIEGKRLIVLDYDGTLAYLDVDWAQVKQDLSAAAAVHGFTSTFSPLWPEMARFKRLFGPQHMNALFDVLLVHETNGVRTQEPRWDVVNAIQGFESRILVGVLSMNMHRTLETGLSQLQLEVGHIIGSDDPVEWKPDSSGLLELMQHSDIGPPDTVFIGDSRRDYETAQAAGVDFQWV